MLIIIYMMSDILCVPMRIARLARDGRWQPMSIYAPIDTKMACETMLELVTLADGAFAAVRPPREDDLARLERMYYRLSAQSIYYRLFVGAPHVPLWANRFATISATTTPASGALVAVVGAEVVGTARFDQDASEASAEVAIVVEDAWQGRGLGRHLLRRLARDAVARHITTFTAHTLAENRRALRLFKGTFAGTRATFDQGEFELVAPLLPISLGSRIPAR